MALVNPTLLLGQSVSDVYTLVQQAADYQKTITYADKDTDQERIISISSSSAYLALSFTDTYVYEVATNGKFRLIGISRART